MPYSKEQVIEMCRQIHGNKYDYSITNDCRNKLGKIKYVCPIHGVVEQIFNNHLQGKGCPKCANKSMREKKTPTKEEFLSKAEKVHNLSEYDWSEFNLLNRDSKGRVEFCCGKHGKYFDWPSNFLKGYGCHICYGKQKNDEEVRQELSEIHPYLDFSEANYSERDSLGRLKVLCQKHGEQKITYWNLRNKQGCYWCGREATAIKNTMTNEEFINKATKIFGEDYTYEHLDMSNRDENGKVTITCKFHGDFKVLPSNFLNGVGCPVCSESSLEGEMRRFLKENAVIFEGQKRFDWLGRQSLDFYLPEYNVAIECQGGQHFKAVGKFGGDKTFKRVVELDERKRVLCSENGVRLLYYSNEKMDFPYEVCTDKEELLKEIRGE